MQIVANYFFYKIRECVTNYWTDEKEPQNRYCTFLFFAIKAFLLPTPTTVKMIFIQNHFHFSLLYMTHTDLDEVVCFF